VVPSKTDETLAARDLEISTERLVEISQTPFPSISEISHWRLQHAQHAHQHAQHASTFSSTPSTPVPKLANGACTKSPGRGVISDDSSPKPVNRAGWRSTLSKWRRPLKSTHPKDDMAPATAVLRPSPAGRNPKQPDPGPPSTQAGAISGAGNPQPSPAVPSRGDSVHASTQAILALDSRVASCDSQPACSSGPPLLPRLHPALAALVIPEWEHFQSHRESRPKQTTRRSLARRSPPPQQTQGMPRTRAVGRRSLPPQDDFLNRSRTPPSRGTPRTCTVARASTIRVLPTLPCTPSGLCLATCWTTQATGAGCSTGPANVHACCAPSTPRSALRPLLLPSALSPQRADLDNQCRT
jgi:hypothetical protein